MKTERNKTEANPKGSFLMKNKKLTLILGIAVVILAIITAAVFLWPEKGSRTAPVTAAVDVFPTPGIPENLKTVKVREPDESVGYELKKPFELVAENSDETGTATDSGYRILLDQYAYSVEELSNKITISPQTGFTIKENAVNDFLLTPLSLKPDELYSISFADEEEGISYSWAFQTRKEFFVTGTLPRDKATYVPVNTGIEISFSHKVENDLSAYFEINPKVNGRFEIHKNIISFVPLSPLQNDTVYTVTVKKGFAYQTDGLTLLEDTVAAFQTEPAPVAKSDGYSCESFDFARRIYNFYPYETPLISAYTNIDTATEVEFRLYRYNNEEDFMKDIQTKDDGPYWCVQYDQAIDYQGKELVLTMATNFLHDQQDDEEWGYYRTKYIQLPQTLPEGHYIAVIKNDTLERMAYVQINGMAVYVGSADNKTLALVYESESATPVKGAEIIFDKFSLVTGQDGLAVSEAPVFDKESSYIKNYSIKRDGHPGYYATIGQSYYSSNYYYDYDNVYGYTDNYYAGNINDLYWGYLFTDRDMYMPTDTVNIWGILADKDGNSAPEKVKVVLSKGYSWYYNADEYAAVDEKEVMLTGTNTFKSSISYENLSQGYYTLQVFSGDELLLSKDISVNKYTKPIYTINTALSERNVLLDEKVEFTMETKFFEGTPVNGMNFNYYISLPGQGGTGMLTTDVNGKARLEFTATNETDSWRPIHADIQVTNADPEETSVNAYESLTIFPRDTMIAVESKTNDKNCTVDITANKITIEGIRNKEWYSTQEYTGGPATVAVEAELYETWYTATQTGTYYNFITKKTHPQYTYDHHENKVQVFTVNTVNGKASFNFSREEGKGYYVILHCLDGNGRKINQQEYLYQWNYHHNDTSWRETDYYTVESEETTYSVNEQAKLSLMCNEEPVQKEENKKALFMLLRKGLIDYRLTDEMTYNVTFQESYIPNVAAMAVYFDGKNFRSTSMEMMCFKNEDKGLNISITPSQQQYLPGDKATFDFKVTDSTGAARKAEILFSIVDEAFFALRDQSVDILYSIYSQFVSNGYNGGSIPHTNTLEDYDYYGGAECGEGGDEASADVRSDFKDTALFESVVTDENGQGQISVVLPDNLTKWRVTYLALTDDLYAGDGTINVDVRLPYFVNTVLNDVFIIGDEPIVQLRSFGTALMEGERVDYTVTVEKDGEIWKNYSTFAPAGQRAYMQMDPLAQGKYTYTVTGKYKEYEDAIQLPFEVLPGFVEQSRTEYQTLTEKSVFPETKWPARVYFFNENVKDYWNELLDLAYSWNNRIDSIIVRKQARVLLKEFFKDTWIRDAKEYDLTRYQLSNGGIALLPYDSANVVLTAKICSLHDSGFDEDLLKEYFYRTLTTEQATSTDIAAAYWGLASLREPVLLELNELVKTPDLKLLDTLYIALAYADIGDLTTADKIYQDIIKKHMKEDTLRAYITIEAEGYDSDDIQEATSLSALLSQKVNGAESDKLFQYVCNMYATDILTSAMRLTYIKSNLKNLNMESSFSWELDGKKETVTIKGRETHSMFLTAEKLKNIRFSDVNGDIVVSTVYTAPIGEISETDDRVTIERTYYDRNGNSKTSFESSEYVKVSLKIKFAPTAPTGRYMVEDYLPASLRYVYSHSEADEWVDNEWTWYPHEISGQKVSFSLYHNNKDKRERIIEYFTRVYNLGDFTADNAAVFNLESNVINYAPRVRISVK